MAVCEKCWGDAYLRMLSNGKSQAENYRELLEERKNSPCKPEEPRENPLIGDSTLRLEQKQ